MNDRPTGSGGWSGYPARKIKTVFRGLWFALHYEVNLFYKLGLSFIVLFLSFYFRDLVDVMVIVAVTAQALTAEIFNTAVEALCDFVEPRENEKIGIIKDISSAAVGVTTAAWILVVGYQCYRLIGRYIQIAG